MEVRFCVLLPGLSWPPVVRSRHCPSLRSINRILFLCLIFRCSHQGCPSRPSRDSPGRGRKRRCPPIARKSLPTATARRCGADASNTADLIETGSTVSRRRGTCDGSLSQKNGLPIYRRSQLISRPREAWHARTGPDFGLTSRRQGPVVPPYVAILYSVATSESCSSRIRRRTVSRCSTSMSSRSGTVCSPPSTSST